MVKSKRRNPASSTTTAAPHATTPCQPPSLVTSLRELNTKLLSRVQTAECAAQRLETQHEADVAAVSALQQQLEVLERRAADRERDVAAMGKLACEREQEMGEMRECAMRREEEMRELGERVVGYEREVGEMRGRWRRVEREKQELEERVVEGEKVVEGLRERVGELEEGWGRRLSLGSIGSSWVGKGSLQRGGHGEVERISLWERFWIWLGSLWRWVLCRRGREAEPLLGRVA